MPRPTAAAAAAFALLLAAEPLAAAELPCRNQTDLAALQLRQLQIELMVAALNCPAESFDYGGTYAAFVGNARLVLVTNARQLRDMFSRAGLGEGAIDHYQTELSNNAQVKSLADRDYCSRLAATMSDAARLSPATLGTYAARLYPRPLGSGRCAAPVEAAMASSGTESTPRGE